MKIKQLAFLLLSIFSAASFAGNYADTGAEGKPENNKDDGSHYYIDLGVNDYYFNQPGTNLPMSTGAFVSDPPYPTAPSSSYNANNWAFNPNITLGYQFLTTDEALQKIFGQQNAVELKISYFHNTGTDTINYGDNYYVVPWFITGSSSQFYNSGSSLLTTSSVDFDNTYADVGLYYTGNKVLDNTLINSPYVGIDFDYLKQDSSYTADLYSASDTDLTSPQITDGTDDLSSYYLGLAFGDKLTKLFATHYGIYGKAGAGLYLMHTTLGATQTPINNISLPNNPALNETYTVNTTDDTFTFKANAEAGLNFYLKNNQDLMSPRITLLAGVDYWNDVAYADNPTAPYQEVQIGYDSSVNPYAGVQVHVPF